MKRWASAQKEFEAAQQALAESPENSEKKDVLLRARQLLDQARSDLKR
jgi:hypothetical protein